ncbi:MAG: serine--tRNA ligase [Chloroflexi bacterium]|nr:serine--tRNA ligase [Chloroflexota bacterium]
MLDIRLIREQPDAVRAALARRGNGDEALVDAILSLDTHRRELVTRADALRGERNRVSKEISQLRDAAARQDRIAAMRQVGDEIAALEAATAACDADLQARQLEAPNLPLPAVPDGPDETANVVVRAWGQPRQLDFPARPHWELGAALDILNLEWGVKLAGSRFYVLAGAGARLQRGVIQWLLDTQVEHDGRQELYVPFVVKEQCLWGAGQLPKFRDNLYRDVEDDLWLVPTAEIPLTNIHAGDILGPEALPQRLVAYTPCFRREKMSAGRDTRGIKRGHQFDKVEMYTYCRPEESPAELDRMLASAEALLRRLELPYRVLQLCTGDLGFGAQITYDIEVWAPGVGEWLEVSSCSNCGDFQARRAGIRFRREAGGRTEYCHTLNGSAFGLPRLMIAILENYQQPDGSIRVPEPLWAYVGCDVISAPAAT